MPARLRGLHVARRVADQHAARRVEPPFCDQIQDHSRRRLAPVAGHAVARDGGVFVGGAEAYVIDGAARVTHGLGHAGVQGGEGRLIVEAAGDAGLVGDDEDVPSGFGRGADCGDGAIDPLPAIMRADPAMVVIDGAVPVEEQRGPVELAGQRDGRARAVGGDIDIEEEAGRAQGVQAAGGGELGQELGFQ